MKTALLSALKELRNRITDAEHVDVTSVSLLLSALAYLSDPVVNRISKRVGITNTSIVEVRGIRFVSGNYRGQQYMAFRGTEFSMWSNVKRILNFIPKKGLKGRKTHRGFVMAFSDLRPHIDILTFDTKSVIFTGHSLGGALAVLAAEYYGASAVTFASPKIFFNEKRDFGIGYVGYNVYGDLVPQVPPSFFFSVWKRPTPNITWRTNLPATDIIEKHRLGTYIRHYLEWYD